MFSAASGALSYTLSKLQLDLNQFFSQVFRRNNEIPAQKPVKLSAGMWDCWPTEIQLSNGKRKQTGPLDKSTTAKFRAFKLESENAENE